jgi:serine-type D-Ala-D-Ala carboxypeptidase/endopeptidase (penicillin-binding protein 4)
MNIKKIILPIVFGLSQCFSAQSDSLNTAQNTDNFNIELNSSGTVFPEKIELSPKQRLDYSIDALKYDPVLKNAHWGFVLYDPEKKEIISQHNAHKAFVPASTTKLLSTESAMHHMGAKFKYRTQLEYSGSVDSLGVLNGNLYLVGSGDFSFNVGRAKANSYGTIFSRFKQALQDKNIKKINGQLIVQTAFFKNNAKQHLPENIVWLEQKDYFLPAGSVQDIRPEQERILPKNYKFSNEKARYYYLSPYNQQMVYTDSLSRQNLSTKLPDAPAYLANYLKSNLAKSGIKITGSIISRMIDEKPEAREYLSHEDSPELSDLVYFTNQTSNNMFAEMLLKNVGYYVKGDFSTATGKEVTLKHFEHQKYDFSGLYLSDGSGLSKQNQVTPISQAKFLAQMMQDENFELYYESLPLAGQTGTLKSMCKGNCYGMVKAKTGTLNKVKTLAGYITTTTGKKCTFSLLINNYNGSVDQVKKRMESLLGPAVNL